MKTITYVVINDSACSNHIELATQQWRKSAPPILSTSHCKFNGARSCAHTRKTIPLAPIHPFTKQIVPLLCPESFVQIVFPSSLCVPYKGLPSTKNIFMHASFFFVSFSSHTFSRACVNPGSIFSNFLCITSL